MKEGFTTKVTPTQYNTICNGCKFLKKERMVCGHKTVTNNFSCWHPDFKNYHEAIGNQHGRTIHFNHEGDCDTPSWCPYLNTNKDEQTY